MWLPSADIYFDVKQSAPKGTCSSTIPFEVGIAEVGIAEVGISGGRRPRKIGRAEVGIAEVKQLTEVGRAGG